MRLAGSIALFTLLAAACLNFSGCALLADRTPAGVVLDQSPYDHFEVIDGVRYHYVEHPGNGPDIFLLHGFGSSTYTWKDVMPILAAQGHHVWALDMKGFGWSDKPLGDAYDRKALMEGVNAFLEAKGLKQVIFVGNSLGGFIGQLLALEHPDKVGKLILVDAAGEPFDHHPLIVKMAHMKFAADYMKMVCGSWVIRLNLESAAYDNAVVTKERVNAYFDRLTTVGGIDAQVAVARSLDLENIGEHAKRLPDIQAPTLIIWGEQDTWIPVACAHMFHKDMPGSQLVIIPNCGHIPQEEMPERTAELIAGFAAEQ